MKDIFGNDIKLGDIVAFNPPYYKGMIKGWVTAFTPKMVRVDYKWQSRPQSTVVEPHNVAIQPTIVYPSVI